MTSQDLTIRRASADELDAIVDVAGSALGWAPGEPHAELFVWKHMHNAFGESPMWVAVAPDGRLAGFRTLMRWELVRPDGAKLRAVRAVDTATHPDFQRRGVFSRLTTAAVDELTAEGVDVVFNTPNEQSRPGYLKLGWIELGRLPVAVRPTSPMGLARTLRARVPAEKWSTPTEVGMAAEDALAQTADVAALLANQPPSSGWATAWTTDSLAWRYRFEPLHYRVWAPDGIDAGLAIFRLRGRGAATECSVTHVLAPGGARARKRRLIGSLARAVEADYLLMVGRPDVRVGMLPLPRQGPRLTARSLATEPPTALADWDLDLGDIELF
jgi:GNAT superfamily N-acetyltransferase